MTELNRHVIWQPAGANLSQAMQEDGALIDPMNAVMHHSTGSVARRIMGVSLAPDPFQMLDKIDGLNGARTLESSTVAQESGACDADLAEGASERTKAKNVVQSNSGLFRKDFVVWLMKNWHIWRKFQVESDRVWAMGRKTYSARTLIEYIRHETTLREIGGEYKINNSYVPDIGRLYNMLNPDKGNFFECRVMQAPTIRTTIRSSVEFNAEGRVNNLMADGSRSGDFSA